MQSIIDLQNSLSSLNDIINSTINPVFTDLQNASHIFDPVVSSHNQVIQVVNDMNTFLNSGIIQGLKGDQGIQGLPGTNANNSIISQVNLKSIADVVYSSTLLQAHSDLHTFVDIGVYEIKGFIKFQSYINSTGGISISLDVGTGNELIGKISGPVTSLSSNDVSVSVSSPSNAMKLTTSGVSSVAAIYFAVVDCLAYVASNNTNIALSFGCESSYAVKVLSNSFLMVKKLS
jgi:hypothetical protein